MDSETVLRALPGDASLELEVTRGNEHWRGGEVTLVADGSGAARVRHRRDGDEREYRGSLEPRRLAALSERLADVAPARPRPLAPDEQMTTLVVRRGSDELLRRTLLENDRYEDERVDGVIGAYEDLTAEVTGGALPFGPGATR